MLAMAYKLGLAVPADQVRPLMESHQEACERAGTDQCQVMAASADADPDDRATASLTLRATPAWMRVFRSRAEADAKDLGGKIELCGHRGRRPRRPDHRHRRRAAGQGRRAGAADPADEAPDQEPRRDPAGRAGNHPGPGRDGPGVVGTGGDEDPDRDGDGAQSPTSSTAMAAPEGDAAPLASAAHGFMSNVFAVLAGLVTMASVLLPFALVGAPIAWRISRRRKPQPVRPGSGAAGLAGPPAVAAAVAQPTAQRRQATQVSGAKPRRYLHDARLRPPARPPLAHPGRNAKLILVRDFLRETPDPDRGWALAALTGDADLRRRQAGGHPQGGRGADGPGAVRLVLRLSSATWPRPWRWSGRPSRAPTASRSCPRWSTPCAPPRAARCSGLIEGWLDALDADGRWALLKLLTGGLRVGALGAAGQAGARPTSGGVDVAEVEEVWHGLTPPYEDLFAWLEGRSERPVARRAGPLPAGDAGAGARRGGRLRQARSGRLRRRVEVGRHPRAGGQRGRRAARLYSRTGDDISGAFPDVVGALDFDGVIDGELLVLRERPRRARSATCSSGSTARASTPS